MVNVTYLLPISKEALRRKDRWGFRRPENLSPLEPEDPEWLRSETPSVRKLYRRPKIENFQIIQKTLTPT